jgi:siroheme synthase-like protein
MIMDNFTRFPFLFELRGKSILFVGGGKVAERKLLSVLQFSPVVTLIAPEITTKINELYNQKKILLIKRLFNDKYLNESFDYVFIATNDFELNRKTALICKKLKIPVNVADNPILSDFHMPSIITDYENDILISVSTNGRNPSKAREVKRLLEEFIKNKNLDIDL